MKTKNQYPEWAEKFRAKGHTIRKVRDGYGLYKCTSVYVPGAKYPRSKQEYLGMITEQNGFIPKKTVSEHPLYIEFGLSHFIWINFKRALIRSSFSGDERVVRLGIIKYIFGSISPVMIRSTYISDGIEDELIAAAAQISPSRVKTIVNKTNSIFEEKLPPDDRNELEQLLRLCVMDKNNRSSQMPALPQEAGEIIERNHLRYGEKQI